MISHDLVHKLAHLGMHVVANYLHHRRSHQPHCAKCGTSNPQFVVDCCDSLLCKNCVSRMLTPAYGKTYKLHCQCCSNERYVTLE